MVRARCPSRHCVIENPVNRPVSAVLTYDENENTGKTHAGINFLGRLKGTEQLDSRRSVSDLWGEWADDEAVRALERGVGGAAQCAHASSSSPQATRARLLPVAYRMWPVKRTQEVRNAFVE